MLSPGIKRIKDIYKSKIIDLLLISEGDGNTHYCWIKYLSKLLTSEIDKSNGKRYFCRTCLSSFRKEEALEKHLKLCKNHEAGIPEMPIKGKKEIFKFGNCNRKMRMPFAMYGNFECIFKTNTKL